MNLQDLTRIGLLTAAISLAACGDNAGAPGGASSGKSGGPPGGGMPPMPVNLLEVKPVQVPSFVEVVATLEGLREVEVRARVTGVVQQQLYKEGEPVAAGAPLFKLDRAPLEIAVDAARASVAQAEALAEQTRRESARLASLAADLAISQRDADNAVSATKTSAAALLSARAQLREAQLNLAYADVSAPMAGVAQRALRSVGALVSPANDSALLTTIVQTHPIRARFALSEAETVQLRQATGSSQGQTVRLLGPDGQPTGASGRLDFGGTVVDPRVGTVQMRAEFPNPQRQWLPGQFVRARIITGQIQAFLVPQAAVMSGDQGRFVWVMGTDSKAAVKPVQTGPWQGKDWVITGGLVAGDRVIVDNLLKLRPGAPVQPAPPPGAASGAAPGTPGTAASAPLAAASK